MTTNELLAVIDREAGMLEADNWHAAAAVMREAAEHLRVRAQIDRAARTLVAKLKGDGDGGIADAYRMLIEAMERVPMNGIPES